MRTAQSHSFPTMWKPLSCLLADDIYPLASRSTNLLGREAEKQSSFCESTRKGPRRLRTKSRRGMSARAARGLISQSRVAPQEATEGSEGRHCYARPPR
jgi:hypothetical protein